MYPQLEENDSVITWCPTAVALKQTFRNVFDMCWWSHRWKRALYRWEFQCLAQSLEDLWKRAFTGQPRKKVPLSVSTVVMKTLFSWTCWSTHMLTYGTGDGFICPLTHSSSLKLKNKTEENGKDCCVKKSPILFSLKHDKEKKWSRLVFELFFTCPVDLNSPKVKYQALWLGKITLDIYLVYHEGIFGSMCKTEKKLHTSSIFFCIFFFLRGEDMCLNL